MVFTISINNFDNAAMEEMSPEEVSREIRLALNTIIGLRFTENKVYDMNGNQVGRVDVQLG